MHERAFSNTQRAQIIQLRVSRRRRRQASAAVQIGYTFDGSA